MKYRKKPITIEAFQFTPGTQNRSAWPAWFNDAQLIAWPRCGSVRLAQYSTGVIELATLEGVMTAQPGDWIIKGVKGELYPCKPDIFQASYEAVSE